MQKSRPSQLSPIGRVRPLAVRTIPQVSLLMGLLAGMAMAQPAARTIEVRLLTTVGSRISHAGDPVRAMVIAPLLEDGVVVVPQGALLTGTIGHVQRLGLSLKHSVAHIDLEFRRLELPEGRNLPFAARITDVETARERVGTSGRVSGMYPGANFSSGMSILFSSMLMQPGIAVPALVFKFSLAWSPDPEIFFPAGTEMLVQATGDTVLPMSDPKAGMLEHLSAEDDGMARKILARLPAQQAEKKGSRPSDLANVLLLGSREQVDRAFRAAGWTGAQRRNPLSIYRTLHCMAQRGGYSTAPMMQLRMNGVRQQASYQKSLNTFAKRHHIRLWKQDTPEVWLSAASEDISYTFNRFSMGHQSDLRIDNERTKVVNDLALTGCLAGGDELERQDLRVRPHGLQPIVTDGKIAVLRLNDCTAPQNVIAQEHHSFGERVAEVSGVVARDVIRSTPISAGIVMTRSMLEQRREGAGLQNTSLAGTGLRHKKAAALETTLSSRWKRESVMMEEPATASVQVGELTARNRMSRKLRRDKL